MRNVTPSTPDAEEEREADQSGMKQAAWRRASRLIGNGTKPAIAETAIGIADV